LVLAVLAAASSLYFLSEGTHSNSEFENFIATHGKSYTTEAEYAYRQSVFEENLQYIRNMNSKGHTFTLGVGKFADLTAEEFANRGNPIHLKESGGPTKRVLKENSVGEVSDYDYKSKDFRDSKMVAKIQDQGECKAGWAFAVTSSVESRYGLKTGKFQGFSEQQIIDCSANKKACNGGLCEDALDYYKSKGAMKYEDYSFEGEQMECLYDEDKIVMKGINSYTYNELYDPREIHKNMLSGPVPIGISGYNPIWQHYKGGVIGEDASYDCKTKLDHRVSVIGYSATKEAWIRNSWGADWGEQGYVYVYNNRRVQEPGVCAVNAFFYTVTF